MRKIINYRLFGHNVNKQLLNISILASSIFILLAIFCSGQAQAQSKSIQFKLLKIVPSNVGADTEILLNENNSPNDIWLGYKKGSAAYQFLKFDDEQGFIDSFDIPLTLISFSEIRSFSVMGNEFLVHCFEKSFVIQKNSAGIKLVDAIKDVYDNSSFLTRNLLLQYNLQDKSNKDKAI